MSATELLGDGAQRAVREAVANVERRTAAEIVVAVRYRSGSYRHTDYLVGFATSVLVLCALLFSGLMTEFIGIHAIFGAFLMGAVIPHHSRVARDLNDRLQDVVVVFLLPAFFAFTGMRTEINLLNGVQNWLLCGVIILVASAGKFGGSAIAARLVGLSWTEGAALGILMNTRGLMELIVLNIGLDLKIISPTLFAMLVVMALVTTFATTPILHVILRGGARAEAGARSQESEARI